MKQLKKKKKKNQKINGAIVPPLLLINLVFPPLQVGGNIICRET